MAVYGKLNEDDKETTNIFAEMAEVVPGVCLSVVFYSWFAHCCLRVTRLIVFFIWFLLSI